MIGLWIGFIAFVLALLALDLGVFHRKAHVVSIREALAWVGVWVSLAMLFSGFVYAAYYHQWFGLTLAMGGGKPDLVGPAAAGPAFVQFLTGYLVEESLSMDNMFVIAMIMAHVHVPAAVQHRLLYWGILGALVMRGAMILAGVGLVHRFDWILYVFGAFLVFTAVKMLVSREPTDLKQNLLVRWTRKLMPVTEEFHGSRFTVRIDGKLWLTPLAVALIAIESADVVFAVDSIPAIFGITRDPFLIFTSNVFAILGLRSLYFALAGIMEKFRYLKVALSVLLAFIGVKMLLKDLLEPIPGLNFWTLAVTVLILATGIVASLLADRRKKRRGDAVTR